MNAPGMLIASITGKFNGNRVIAKCVENFTDDSKESQDKIARLVKKIWAAAKTHCRFANLLHPNHLTYRKEWLIKFLEPKPRSGSTESERSQANHGFSTIANRSGNNILTTPE